MEYHLPFRLPRKSDRGGKPALQQRTANQNRFIAQVEELFNKLVSERREEVQMHTYADIAHAMGVDADKVRDAFGGMGGYNGITVRRPTG
jgi:hypothetical protein